MALHAQVAKLVFKRMLLKGIVWLKRIYPKCQVTTIVTSLLFPTIISRQIWKKPDRQKRNLCHILFIRNPKAPNAKTKTEPSELALYNDFCAFPKNTILAYTKIPSDKPWRGWPRFTWDWPHCRRWLGVRQYESQQAENKNPEWIYQARKGRGSSRITFTIGEGR